MVAYALTIALCFPIIGQTGDWQPRAVFPAAGPQQTGLLAATPGLVGSDEPSSSGTLAGHPAGRTGDKGRQALTLGVATAALILTDQETHDLIGTSASGTGHDVNQWVQSFGREAGAASVAGLYLLGDDYDKQTAKMAATAALSAGLTTEVMKRLTGRERPNASTGAGDFHGPLSGGSSFPSGHTAAAFSLATVYGRRYPKYEWAFDALAVGVGVARMRENSHYLSDVFVGAAVGTCFGHRALKGKGGLFGFRF